MKSDSKNGGGCNVSPSFIKDMSTSLKEFYSWNHRPYWIHNLYIEIDKLYSRSKEI